MSGNQSSHTYCIYENVCSGCPEIANEYSFIYESKKNELLKILFSHQLAEKNKLSIRDFLFPEHQMRCRVDLTIQTSNDQTKIGFYSIDKSSLIDTHQCVALLPELQESLLFFRKALFPISKGSFRLRISPDKKKGLWLDFSHDDIKHLFEQRNWLLSKLEHFYIEIGQRRKKLVVNKGQLKLQKQSLYPWFETYVQGKPHPLWCQVSSFTQPSYLSNRCLISEIERMSRGFSNLIAVELGSGIGNFSIPLSHLFKELICLENDKWSLQNLKYNLEVYSIKAHIEPFDFNKKSSFKYSFPTPWALFADPPRSGLGEVLQQIPQQGLPEIIIYVSCYPESFIKDTTVLHSRGFNLEEISIVDQFPFTRHLELIALFKRKN